MAHNVHDLLDCRDIRLPKRFVVHGTLRGRLLEEKSRLEPELYLAHLISVFRQRWSSFAAELRASAG